MTILVSALITSLRATLLDPSPGTTWLDADFLRLVNEGERNACMLRPELYTVHAAIPMVAGTLQVVPAGGTAIMRLDENAVSKRRCRLVDASLLDAFYRFWPAATPETDVQEWTQDPRDRKRFTVTPPNTGTGSVIALYGMTPPAIANIANPINLDDIYELPLKHFVLGECYAMNTQRQDLVKATFYRTSFEKMLGVNSQSTVAVLPKVGNQGGA